MRCPWHKRAALHVVNQNVFSECFSTVSDQISLTRALHDYELANAVGPLDHDELVARAIAALPSNGGVIRRKAPHSTCRVWRSDTGDNRPVSS